MSADDSTNGTPTAPGGGDKSPPVPPGPGTPPGPGDLSPGTPTEPPGPGGPPGPDNFSNGTPTDPDKPPGPDDLSPGTPSDPPCTPAPSTCELKELLGSLAASVQDLKNALKSPAPSCPPAQAPAPSCPPASQAPAPQPCSPVAQAATPPSCPALAAQPCDSGSPTQSTIHYYHSQPAATSGGAVASAMIQLNTMLLGSSPAFAQAMRLQTDAIASGLGSLNAVSNQRSHYTLELAAAARGVVEAHDRRSGGGTSGGGAGA